MITGTIKVNGRRYEVRPAKPSDLDRHGNQRPHGTFLVLDQGKVITSGTDRTALPSAVRRVLHLRSSSESGRHYGTFGEGDAAWHPTTLCGPDYCGSTGTPGEPTGEPCAHPVQVPVIGSPSYFRCADCGAKA